MARSIRRSSLKRVTYAAICWVASSSPNDFLIRSYVVTHTRRHRRSHPKRLVNPGGCIVCWAASSRWPTVDYKLASFLLGTDDLQRSRHTGGVALPKQYLAGRNDRGIETVKGLILLIVKPFVLPLVLTSFHIDAPDKSNSRKHIAKNPQAFPLRH